MFNNFNIILDFKNFNISQDIKVIQGDKKYTKFSITMIENGVVIDISSFTAEISYLKSDGKYVVQKNDISIIDPINGYLEIIVAEQALTCAGLVKCELSFYDNTGGKITSVFSFRVKNSLLSEGVFQSLDEVAFLNEYMKLLSSYVSVENKRVEEEKLRVQNEIERINNENSRKQAEILREIANNSYNEEITNTLNNLKQRTLMIYKSTVNSYSDIAINYPNPENGWVVQCRDTMTRWRYDGFSEQWVDIGQAVSGDGGGTIPDNLATVATTGSYNDLVDKPTTYIHTQLSSSNVWTIPHKLNKYPSVTIVDSAGTVVLCDIVYVDKNTVVAFLSSACGGLAYIN